MRSALHQIFIEYSLCARHYVKCDEKLIHELDMTEWMCARACTHTHTHTHSKKYSGQGKKAVFKIMMSRNAYKNYSFILLNIICTQDNPAWKFQVKSQEPKCTVIFLSTLSTHIHEHVVIKGKPSQRLNRAGWGVRGMFLPTGITVWKFLAVSDGVSYSC